MPKFWMYFDNNDYNNYHYHDMLISSPSNTLYVLELSVGFETNLDNNADRKFPNIATF